MKFWLSFFLVVTPLFSSVAEVYVIDPASSNVRFSVRHLGIHSVHGKFEKFGGWFEYDPGNAFPWKASATIVATSINTGIKDRDSHLRSKDFFEAETFPIINFYSQELERGEKGTLKAKGTLTMHGISKPIALDLQGGEILKDHSQVASAVEPQGQARIVFSATAKLNRKDFGIKGGSSGGLIGKEVRIDLQIQGVARNSSP